MKALAPVLAVLLFAGCSSEAASSEDNVGERARLFAGATPLKLTLSGPLEHHFDLAHAGMPDGIFPPQRVTDWFAGSLKQGQLTRQVEIQVRGNSSLQECSFPKLKVKMPRETSTGTIFEGAHKFKIGTHCGDDSGPGTIGRLRHENSAHREAFVYTLLGIVGIDGMATRPARITYKDTDQSTSITRDAFVLENPELFGERLGGKTMEEQEAMTSAQVERMDRTRIAAIHLFEALAGNWDWKINLGSGPGGRVWNIEVVTFTNADPLPVPHDFDLSSMVTGAPLTDDDLPEDLWPERPVLERQAAHYLSGASGKFKAANLSAAVAMFEGKHDSMIDALGDTDIDTEGVENIKAHIDAFYATLTDIDEIVKPAP
jgi:hypothetical protein